VSGKIIQNSYHGYRKVVSTNSVNVSGKVIQDSYHGYRKVVGTNSINVSGKIIQNSYHGYKNKYNSYTYSRQWIKCHYEGLSWS
jgi:DNA-directed RNA polymerase subunit N (RpoN/RPB10)